MELEIESKWLLSRADFLSTLGKCRQVRVKDQLNVYFDSHWRLAENGSTFRFRRVAGKDWQLTLKVPAPSHNNKARAMWEMSIVGSATQMWAQRLRVVAEIAVASLPRDFTNSLLALGIERLSRVGWMRTCRHVVAWPCVGEFELDEFTLPGGHRMYEAEFETDDAELRTKLTDALLSAAPSAHPSLKSKFQRFRDAIENPKNSTWTSETQGTSTQAEPFILS